jgi:nicotinate-nucleotide pyrophosphorylase (carboxylating)
MHKPYIKQQVSQALSEDLNGQTAFDGDITAQLIPATQQATGKVITRELAVICGVEWVNETMRQVDSSLVVTWLVKDGDEVKPDQTLFIVKGAARAILTAERTALNFLQTLSATATSTHKYVSKVKGLGSTTKILDTRKTIPGLRFAQKYAVKCGGGENHRIGLFDAYLIKENHIQAAGGITQAVARAQKLNPNKTIEVEVESEQELMEAIEAGAHIIMLDNFDVAQTASAIALADGRVKLEASGNMDGEKFKAYAQLNVDFISIGGLTKHIEAIDLSMRFTEI